MNAPCLTDEGVAPLAGAWIETEIATSISVAMSCRPPRGGVDRNAFLAFRFSGLTESPPSRGRGSKPSQQEEAPTRQGVAPLAGAWIETIWYCSSFSVIRRRPPRGGVDRNRDRAAVTVNRQRRPPRGGVDRNGEKDMEPTLVLWSPPSRGRGSKPCGRFSCSWFQLVAPLAGAWIETPASCRHDASKMGRPPRGGVDRNGSATKWPARTCVAPLAGAWIETPPTLPPCNPATVAPLAGAWIETP